MSALPETLTPCSHCKKRMTENEYREHIELMTPQEIRAWFLRSAMSGSDVVGSPFDYFTPRD